MSCKDQIRTAWKLLPSLVFTLHEVSWSGSNLIFLFSIDSDVSRRYKIKLFHQMGAIFYLFLDNAIADRFVSAFINMSLHCCHPSVLAKINTDRNRCSYKVEWGHEEVWDICWTFKEKPLFELDVVLVEVWVVCLLFNIYECELSPQMSSDKSFARV